MNTIVLTGPESSGKTTLARQLAEHFGTVWVPEFARGYIEKLGRKYMEADLLEIAKGQINLEKEFAEREEKTLFLDTSLEVIKIWSEVRFEKCDPWITENNCQRKHDLYLLCRPDLPWEFDPQRENPNDREMLFQKYISELKNMGVDFFEIYGTGEKRLENAINTVHFFFEK